MGVLVLLVFAALNASVAIYGAMTGNIALASFSGGVAMLVFGIGIATAIRES